MPVFGLGRKKAYGLVWEWQWRARKKKTYFKGRDARAELVFAGGLGQLEEILHVLRYLRQVL